MIAIKKILVPTDFAPLSVPAVGYAISLAKDHGAEVFVFHAVPGAAMKGQFLPGYIAEGLPAETAMGVRSEPGVGNIFATKKQILVNFLEQRIAPELLRAVKITPLIKLGKVVEEVVAAAKEERCDLIVMTSQASRLRRLFHGSFTERVVRRAPCPVLSIQPSAEVRTEKDEWLAAGHIDKWAA
jgi:nucleotide-binding universal stress UspA family protein